MPKNKDLKRRVRARMAKTGESYTAARAQLLGRTPPPLPDDHEAIAGQRDAVVVERTGRDWAAWVAELDEAGATEMDHAAIARWVAERVDNAWWAQTVAIGYGRLVGRREPGMSSEGDFQASKSKTLRVSQQRAYELLMVLAGDAAWLEGLELAGNTAPKSMRFKEGATRAAVWLADKDDRCTVSVNHTKLGSREEVEHSKAAWARRLTALAAAAVEAGS